MSDYTISVQGHGEEIEYAEGDERFIFEVSFAKVPYRLYARQFWTYRLPNGPHRLPEGKKHIVERVAQWMSSDGKPTELVWEEEPYLQPLKSVDQLLAERLARRRIS